jgi:hypothetical protein
LQDNSHCRNIDFGLPSNKEKEIPMKEVTNDYRRVNSHDPKTFASFLVKDAKWTDIMGYTIIGGTEFYQQHTYPSQTVLKEAKLDVNVFRNKWITIKWDQNLFRNFNSKYRIINKYNRRNLE